MPYASKEDRNANARAKRAANLEKYRIGERKKVERNPRIYRSIWLKKTYGITADEYDNMLADQGGCCKLCRRAPGKRPLDVDHDHATGKVRGLLCNQCNRTLVMIDRLGIQPFIDYYR